MDRRQRGALSISLVEPVSWQFEFGDGTVLRVDTLWRVVTGEVEVTSADPGHQFGLPEPVNAGVRARQALSTARVRHVSLSQRSGDLVMQFDNDAALEVLTTSTGYEGWSITSPTRDEIIGLGGGRPVNEAPDDPGLANAASIASFTTS